MSVTLLQGDCRDVLRTLPDQSVHCCISSPPYWGLRSYLPEGHADKAREIGSEATIDEWVATIVEVFREVRRVLRDDGTCWVNLGDSYASVAAGGIKPKDLIGQPWRVAFAMQADGWWWRDTIVWAKKNPMPSSVTDRCTPAWEPVLMFSKSARYYFDAEAIKEPAQVWTGRAATFDRSGNEVAEHVIPGQTAAQHRPRLPGNKTPHPPVPGLPEHNTRSGLLAYAQQQQAAYKMPDGCDTGAGGHGAFHRKGREKGKTLPPKAAAATSGNDGAYADGKSERMGRGAGWRDRVDPNAPPMANKRNVWSIASEPFRGSHFATFPTELVRPMVLAGCPVGGTVLDPFGGSGTVGLVADRLQRHAVLIDLDARNIPMAEERIHGDAPLFAEVVA